jgi:hypothetical protein
VTIPGSSLTTQRERGALTLRRDTQFSARGSRRRTHKPEAVSISRPSPVRFNPVLAVLWVDYAAFGAYVIASQAASVDRMIVTNLAGDLIEGRAREEGRDQ